MSRSQPFVVDEQACPFEGWSDGAPGSVRWRTLVSGDRTPSDSLTVGVAELEPGAEGPLVPHRHAQPEVYYVLSGEGIVRISGVEYPIRAGSAVFIPGGAEHGARNTGAQLLRLLYAFPAGSFSEIRYEFAAT